MFNARRTLGVVLSVLAMATALTGQGTITVPNTLTVGTKSVISYENAGKAGQTITVTVDDGGFPFPNQEDIQITLDASGKGSADWTVPDWDGGKFRAPEATAVSRQFS